MCGRLYELYRAARMVKLKQRNLTLVSRYVLMRNLHRLGFLIRGLAEYQYRSG